MAAKALKKTDAKFLKMFADFISEHKETLDTLAADMREHFDGKSENWQSGDNGTAYSEVLEAIESTQQSIEAANDSLQGLPLWEDA